MRYLIVLLFLCLIPIKADCIKVGQYLLHKSSFNSTQFQVVKNLIKEKAGTYKQVATFNALIPVTTDTWKLGLYHWHIGKPFLYDSRTNKIWLEIDTRIENWDKFANALNAGKINKIGQAHHSFEKGWDKKGTESIYKFNKRKKKFIDKFIYEVETSTP